MFRKILNVLATILLIVLIFIVVIVFKARISGEIPSLFGYQIYRVSSGSMSPELEIGDVILDKAVDPEEIHNGDIITYRGTEDSYADKIITHKVVKEPVLNSNGTYTIQTQGVAVGALLDPEINSSQVLGKFVCKLAFLDALYTFFLSDYGLIAFVGVIVVLFAYEIISMILSYKSIDEVLDEEYQTPKKKKKSKKNRK